MHGNNNYYSFATAVFTKLGSLLSGLRRPRSVLGAPDFRGMTTSEPAILGHIQFGTQSLRDMPKSEHIVTSGSVISGQA